MSAGEVLLILGAFAVLLWVVIRFMEGGEK